MTDRKCKKCGDGLVVNEKLGLMECISGRHMEPINTLRAQWWNQCPKCKQKGVNDSDAEHLLQAYETNTDGSISNRPVIIENAIIFNENKSQKSITCKACGYTFTKK